MSRYRKYTGNYLAIIQGLRLTDELNGRPLIDTRPTSKSVYTTDILKDKYRATVVELRNPEQYNAETTREEIYAPSNHAQDPRYGQGEYDAAFAYWITDITPDLLNIHQEASDETFKTYFAFPYIDDKGVPCALSVARFGHDPTAQFIITLVRNTHAPYEEREVTFIAHNDIMKTSYYAAMHGAHSEEEIDENRIMRSLRLKIGSQNVSQLLGSLFTQEGTITEENFVQLKARIRHRNVDNRDILTQQIPRLIQIVKKINVGLAQQIQSVYTQDFVDFFKQKRYEQLLREVIAHAQHHKPKKPEAIAELQDLYLEFLVIQLYSDQSNSRESFLAGGISETESTALLSRFNLDNPLPLNETAFADKINQFYRNIHCTMLITRLKHAIHDCESPLVQENAKSELQWIRNLGDNFLNLKPSKQKTAIAFVTQLINFTQTPESNAYYLTLKKLYPKVRLDPAKLENVKSNLEITQFNQQISTLKHNIKTCPHPYVRRELAKNVEFLKRIIPSFSSSSIVEKISINLLLISLNTLATESTESNLSTLEEHYRQLELPSIPLNERAQLLLPANIAYMQHEIEQNNYLFDTQGRILVSTLDSTQNNQPTMWSLDVATHAPDLSAQFNKFLSTTLQKQTTAIITGNILGLFYQNKTHIFPLQQSLQIFLNQIAQTYQRDMSPDIIISDETREAALLATMRSLNVAVMESLAQSLVAASIHSTGRVLRKLNTQTVNNALISAQETLRQQGQNLLIQNLHEQLQTHATGTPSLENALNPIVCFDITHSLATEITSMQINSEYNCRQIQAFRCAAPDFVPRNKTTHLRIHSNALSVPEGLSPIDYQTQFNQRLSKIASTCQFRYNRPVTYYLYDASSEQIQKSIAAIHNFNRRIRTAEYIVPLCWLQTYNPSEPGIPLGAPLFTNTTSEITLLFEMTLCNQISMVDSKKKLDLGPYYSFLNRAPSLLGDWLRSPLFAASSEGRQTGRQITDLKTAWQQAENSERHLSTKESVTNALQKMLAFDLHYDPQYALLIQALSLTIQETSILNDESAAQQATTLALGHAQIFDLATLPTEIQVPLNTLLHATEKRTAIQAANLLSTAMEDYCAQHQNTAGMLPIYQKATEAAHEATSPEDIARTKAHLLTTPEPSKPAVKISTRQPNSPPSSADRKKTVHRSHHPEQSATSLGQGRHGLFGARKEQFKQTESILKKAGQNKAAAFNKRRTPGSGSDSDT
jgi:hypothetical protein